MYARLVVLISGGGSNLQAILDACADGSLPARVVAVISNQPHVLGILRAEKAGIAAIVFSNQKGESRHEYDARLVDEVATWQPDYIVLAGWMRLLTSAFLGRFPNRVINLHPALPGTFPGTHAIERSYAAYQRGEIDRSGVMVHLVPDEGVDNGPILSSRELFFQPAETLEQFETRMHALEHTLLVDTLKLVISGGIGDMNQ